MPHLDIILNQKSTIGPRAAELASRILYLRGEELPLKGVESKNTVVTEDEMVPFKKGYTHIFRRNASLLFEAARFAEHQRFFHALIDFEDLIKKISSLYGLFKGNRRKITHPQIKIFSSWDEVKVLCDFDFDFELKYQVSFILEYRDKTPETLKMIKKYNTSDSSKAEVLLSTAHKSKGLEWGKVRIDRDFLIVFEEDPDVVSLQGAEFFKDRSEEFNLLYVALTRGTAHLSVAHGTDATLRFLEELYCEVFGKEGEEPKKYAPLKPLQTPLLQSPEPVKKRKGIHNFN
jgi:superfamily I DNA/RNA helicase